jgi:hypothetical protein
MSDENYTEEGLSINTRRSLLKASAASIVTSPKLVDTTTASRSTEQKFGTITIKDEVAPKRTNGKPDVPAAIIKGGYGNPIPERRIRNQREKMFKRFDTGRKGVLDENIVPEGEHLLAYGIRIEAGSPIEYMSSIPEDAQRSAFREATEAAHTNIERFKKGEI